MVKLSGAAAQLMEAFPEARTISAIEQINQNGLYLYFDGASSSSTVQDTARFALVVAQNYIQHSSAPNVLAEVEKVRDMIYQLSLAAGRNFFAGIKSATFSGSMLHLYAVMVEVPLQLPGGEA